MKRAIILVFAFIAFLTPLRAEKGVFGEPKFTSTQQLVGHVIIPQQDLKDAYYNTIKKSIPILFGVNALPTLKRESIMHWCMTIMNLLLGVASR